jgi:hypothetical protein
VTCPCVTPLVVRPNRLSFAWALGEGRYVRGGTKIQIRGGACSSKRGESLFPNTKEGKTTKKRPKDQALVPEGVPNLALLFLSLTFMPGPSKLLCAPHASESPLLSYLIFIHNLLLLHPTVPHPLSQSLKGAA